MKVRSLFLILALLLQACGKPVNIDEIKEGFVQNKVSFEQLDSMIKEDTKTKTCFAVGIDHIGDFWEHDNKWNTNQNYDRKVSLEIVLREVGISSDRYNQYLALFKIVGSERVEHCSNTPSWTRIMVHRSGLAVSGCLTTVNINGDVSMPETDIKPGYAREITDLSKGWYINHDCT